LTEQYQLPVTYTNRKGRTYYLCQGITQTGNPHYYFTQKPKDKVLEHIPQGYRISESVNGRVSLVKDRPMQILPEEVSAVEAALQSHPKAQNYRVNVKHDRIEVYELVGRSADDLIAALARQGMGSPDLAERIRADQEQYGRFTPVLRFVLADEARRTFRVDRASYLDDGWDGALQMGSVDKLASRWIPRLGSDEFFDSPPFLEHGYGQAGQKPSGYSPTPMSWLLGAIKQPLSWLSVLSQTLPGSPGMWPRRIRRWIGRLLHRTKDQVDRIGRDAFMAELGKVGSSEESVQ
jgi:hypothetical protein